jgi:hypothetical protein
VDQPFDFIEMTAASDTSQDSSAQRSLLESVHSFERELGVDPGFLQRVFNEPDDWAFVVKVHALAEAALTHLLTVTLGREELRDVFSGLAMGARHGKLAIAEKLMALDAAQVRFFRALGRLRNQFVHDVRGLDQRIEVHVNAWPDVESARFWRDVGAAMGSQTEIIVDGSPVPVETFSRNNPKLALWLASMNSTALIYVTQQSVVERRAHERTMMDAFQALLKLESGPYAPKFDSPDRAPRPGQVRPNSLRG